MSQTLVATATKTRKSRAAVSGLCPACGDGVNLAGSSHKCKGCGLVAPRTAFTAQSGSSNVADGTAASRAWTLGGRVD